MSDRKKLGEMLIDAGLLDESRLQIGLADQRQWNRPLGVTLVLLDLVDEAEMLRVLGRQLSVPTASLAKKRLRPELRELLPYEIAKSRQCLPLHIETEGGKKDLYVGMSNPTDLEVLDDLRFRTGMQVHAVLVSRAQLDAAIERQYCHGGFDPETVQQPGTARDFELEGSAPGAPASAPARETPTQVDAPAAQPRTASVSDRRKHPRVPMNAVMGVLRCPSPAAGVDISVGGICFACDGLGVEVGDRLPMELMLQGQSVIVVGSVIRVTNFTGLAQEVGLAFSEISPEAQELLEQVLSTSSGLERP